jgi:hypothetical protein
MAPEIEQGDGVFSMIRDSGRHFRLFFLFSAFVILPLNRGTAETAPALPERLTADQLVSRMVEKNEERANALESYQGRRSYSLNYVGFPAGLRAEMTVTMTYKAPATKEFSIVSESGNKWLINHIFQRLLDSEREALDAENRANTALTSKNYNFTLISDRPAADGCSYVLAVEPKIPNKFLYRGRVWINSQDFAVCRIEAEPAKNPSFWIKKTDIHHDYVKIGDFWLPADNESVSSVRLGGVATLTIKYEDYKILQSHALNQMSDRTVSGFRAPAN